MSILKIPKISSARRTPVPPKSPSDSPQDAAAGGRLMAALMDAATRRGHNLTALAKALNVTYGYLVQLRSGSRSPVNISDDFAARCARYLELPRLSVLLLAGRLSPADVFGEQAMNEVSLAQAYGYLLADPIWGARVPELSEQALQQSKDCVLAMIWLYQELKGVSLLPSPGTVPEGGDATPGEGDAGQSSGHPPLP